MNQKKLSNIFESSNIDKLHTVSFIEAFNRLQDICGHKLSKEIKDKITKLNAYRDRITHSEISINDNDIMMLFSGFIDSLDIYFFKQLGDNYKTLSGYSNLTKNHKEYSEWVQKEGKILKSKVINEFANVFKVTSYGMGFNEVKRVRDIDLAAQIINEITSKDFKFGLDLYNGICSGNITNIKRIDKEHFSLFAEDNNGEYIFKFKSLILFMPEIKSDFSPIIIFESDQDNNLSQEEKLNCREEFCRKGKYLIEGIKIHPEYKFNYDKEFLNKFYNNDLETRPEYYLCDKFISKGIFCIINIQGLKYRNFGSIVREHTNMDGIDFEIVLRQYILNKQQNA